MDIVPLQRGVPIEVARSVQQRQIAALERTRKRTHGDRDEMLRSYYTGIVHPGTPVGIRAAQGCSRPYTQGLLNAKHTSGQSRLSNIKQASTGINRMKELLDMPKVLKNGYFTVAIRSSVEVPRNIVHVDVGAIISHMDPEFGCTPPEWTGGYAALTGDNRPVPRDRVRIAVNMVKLWTLQIALRDIANVLAASLDDNMLVMFSPTCFGIVDVCFDSERLTPTQFGREFDRSAFVDEILEPRIRKMSLIGMDGVTSVFEDNDSAGGRRVLTMQGGDFRTILRQPYVDPFHTISSNVWDMYAVYGIEVARELLVAEMKALLDPISPSQVKLLVDRMVFAGVPQSVSRYTIRKFDEGFLPKTTFEEFDRTMRYASFLAETDDVGACSAHVLFGNVARVGPTTVDVLIDLDMISGGLNSYLEL
jgi:RNA polymerase Rpb1, domain 5